MYMCIYIYVQREGKSSCKTNCLSSFETLKSITYRKRKWHISKLASVSTIYCRRQEIHLFSTQGINLAKWKRKKKVPVKQQISRFTLLLFYKSTKPLLFSLSDLINWSFVPLYTALWEFKTTIRPEETLASENHTFYSFSTKTSTLSSEVCLTPPPRPRPPPSPIVEHFMNPTAVTVTFRTVANVLWWDDRGGSC